jgi:hypothetical protein
LAKQFGVSDEAIAGLNDPESHPFPPDQKAALRFADAMTTGRGGMPDEIFADLRRHFDEPQIVEMGAVIGLFNYFNRFNNALQVAITLMDPGVLARRAGEAIGTHAGRALWIQIAALIGTGRRFDGVEIHGRPAGGTGVQSADGADTRLALLARHGPEPSGQSAALAPREIETAVRDGVARPAAGDRAWIAPARHAGVVTGAIVVRRDRPGSIDEEDRTVVDRVAAIIAPRLAARP